MALEQQEAGLLKVNGLGNKMKIGLKKKKALPDQAESDFFILVWGLRWNFVEAFRWCFWLSGRLLEMSGSILRVLSSIWSYTHSCDTECKLSDGTMVLLVSTIFSVFVTWLVILLMDSLERDVLVRLLIIPKLELHPKSSFIF